MIRRPPRSTLDRSSAASDVYKRQAMITAICDVQQIKVDAAIEELKKSGHGQNPKVYTCLLYTSPSPRDRTRSRMPSSA